MRKQTTKVLEKPSNGGKHCQKAWRKVSALVVDHGFKDPRLYHLVLKGEKDNQFQSVMPYQKALKAICRKLTLENIKYHWRACAEQDEEKGLHFHVFILAESKYFNSCGVINTTKAAFLTTLLTAHKMKFYLAPPKAAMHRNHEGKQLNYATLAGAKLDDCIERLSYLVKARSKPLDMRTIYFSSRVPRRTAPAEPALTIG